MKKVFLNFYGNFDNNDIHDLYIDNQNHYEQDIIDYLKKLNLQPIFHYIESNFPATEDYASVCSEFMFDENEIQKLSQLIKQITFDGDYQVTNKNTYLNFKNTIKSVNFIHAYKSVEL